MTRATEKKIASIPLIVAGLVMIACWIWLQGVNRSPAEDNLGWFVFSIGAAMVGAGISLPIVRLPFVLLIALFSPFAVFAALVALLWGYIVLYVVFYDLALWFYGLSPFASPP